MAEFKETVIGVVLVGVFALALLTFVYQAQVENNVADNIMNEPSLSGLNDTLTSNLEGVRGEAQDQREGFESDEAFIGDEGFGLTSIIGVTKKFTSLMFGTFNIVTGGIANILGIPAIVINVIVGALIITILLLGWRVIKAGGT